MAACICWPCKIDLLRRTLPALLTYLHADQTPLSLHARAPAIQSTILLSVHVAVIMCCTGIDKGAGKPNGTVVGKVTKAQVEVSSFGIAIGVLLKHAAMQGFKVVQGSVWCTAAALQLWHYITGVLLSLVLLPGTAVGGSVHSAVPAIGDMQTCCTLMLTSNAQKL